MKTAGEIRNRVVELLEAELDRRVQEASQRLPHRCVHNHRQPLDQRRRVDGELNPQFNRTSKGTENGRSLPVLQEIGLCMMRAETPDQWQGTICDEPIDAGRCPYFTPSQSKEELFAQFTLELQYPSWVQQALPEVAALLWVLELTQAPSISWWKKLWFRFIRVRLEPVKPPFNIAALLPSRTEDSKGS